MRVRESPSPRISFCLEIDAHRAAGSSRSLVSSLMRASQRAAFVRASRRGRACAAESMSCAWTESPGARAWCAVRGPPSRTADVRRAGKAVLEGGA